MKHGYNARKKQFVIYEHWETHMDTKIEMETTDDTWTDKEYESQVYNKYR